MEISKKSVSYNLIISKGEYLMTEYSSNTGIDSKLYENVTPPTPEHNNVPDPDEPDYSDLADLAKLTMADFLKQEETPFTITLPGAGEVQFKLDEVKPLTTQMDDAVIVAALGEGYTSKERFSVLFLGPQDLTYEQGNYLVSQKETAFKAIFLLVPVRGAYSKEDNESHIYLEAVFN